MTPAEPARLVSALTRAARFGTYFEAEFDDSLTTVWDLDAAVAAWSRRLGTTEPRVAVSSMQYEFAERLWSVSLGAWAFGRVIPDFTRLRYRTTPEGAFVFGFAEPRAWDCTGQTPDDVATLLSRSVIEGQLVTFHDTVRAAVKVAPGLLWGNAANGLVLSARSAGRARSCYAIALALLDTPPLADRLTGSISTSMRRRSCCLFYRTGAGRKCGDCPLASVPA